MVLHGSITSPVFLRAKSSTPALRTPSGVQRGPSRSGAGLIGSRCTTRPTTCTCFCARPTSPLRPHPVPCDRLSTSGLECGTRGRRATHLPPAPATRLRGPRRLDQKWHHTRYVINTLCMYHTKLLPKSSFKNKILKNDIKNIAFYSEQRPLFDILRLK